jgi:hypothetical protein
VKKKLVAVWDLNSDGKRKPKKANKAKAFPFESKSFPTINN